MTSSRPVVVTGAGGLVGAAVCADLRHRGHDVVGVGRSPGAEVTTVADLAMQPLVEALGEIQPLAVVHCAALVPTNPDHPDSAASAAITRQMDTAVHAAATRWGAPVVYFSSTGVYEPRTGEVNEEGSPVVSRSPYFAAKLAGERLFATADRAVVARLSGPIGRRMRPHLVLPRFVRAALRGETLTLWGSGSREQDYVHVADVARFVACALSASDKSGVFNVASGRPVSMRELAEAVTSRVGRGDVVLEEKADPLDGETARYSVARARSLLGWTPTRTLSDMIDEIIDGLEPDTVGEQETL